MKKNEEARDVCSQNQSDITKIYQMFLQYQPFQLQNPPNMTTLATKDVASQEIVDDILSVFDRGVTCVKEFIDQRLNGSKLTVLEGLTLL